MTIHEAIPLAVQHHQAERLDEAAALYQQILALQPDNIDAIAGQADVFFQQGNLPAALPLFHRFAELRPRLVTAHTVLGIALLTAGDLPRGWTEFEWRWQAPEMLRRRAALVQPLWDGSPLAGRRILLHGERGGGDTIHFIRYVPLVAAAGGQVILTCQPELHPLVRSMHGVTRLVNAGEPLPEFDLHCALVSLPAVLRTTLQNIPASVPYLHPDPAAVQRFRSRIPPDGRLKIGLVWAGQPSPPGRSIPLAALAPLAQIPGVTFYSLQKGPPAQEAQSSPFPLIDWTHELSDFGATAALIQNLDLIIGVDTSVPQLAGAMGKPTWLLLKFVPDWRWMLHRPDSPWYPTMRLFRQPRIGDWPSVVNQVVQSLK